MRRVLTIAPLFALAMALAVGAAEPTMSVPPARVTSVPLPKTQTALLLKASTPALSITLPAPTAEESASLNPLPTARMRMKPLAVGFGRDIPVAQRDIVLGALKWQVAADGSVAAQIDVTSTGAASLRLELQMAPTDPDVVVRLRGSGAHALPMGPFAANAIAEATARNGGWWSPILEGSTATVEIAMPAGTSIGTAHLSIVRVSHIVQDGTSLAPGAEKSSGIGTSGLCEIDWKCETPTPALTNAANAVAKMLFTQGNGSTYLCSGTLVNDSIHSSTPYFFTADHCINSAYAAQTLNTYWFYDSIGCSDESNPGASTTVGSYVLNAHGATLLARSVAEDWALLRLNQTPPAGTTLSAWNALPIANGAVVDLHHPSGDLKKFSSGGLSGYESIYSTDEDTGDRLVDAVLARVIWGRGVTEGGSSGSGLLTFNGNGYYELRGGLMGGESSCSTPNDPDYYSRFDQMIPKVRDYLAPGTNPANIEVVVEFYNKSLDHYFMTASADEINKLDTGYFSGWERTGLRFLAYSTQVPGSSPVCRAYLPTLDANTHFYSAAPAECQALTTDPRFSAWIVESYNVFYIRVPDSNGNCAAGTHPVWRFYHTTRTNHRYTDDVSIHGMLSDNADWIAEGYGPDSVIMCSPNGQ